MTKIDIISGFLGAGKTTFIKKLLEEAISGEQVVLIENEFGEIGIDGGFLKDSGIEIREMNSGCICCSLVGDFGKSLAEVLTKYKPDRVIIEPSGVGKLSDVMKAVRDVAAEIEVTLNSAVTIVDVAKCRMYMKNFGEFFNNQIENAGTVVLSRTDITAMDKVNQAVELIREKKIEDAVEVVEGYIPDKEVEKYFAACDLVVLPYESATQSGIVQIAYGFRKPVLVTNVGGLPDVVTDGKTGYVVESKNPEQIADAVIRYFKEEKEEEFAQNVKAEEYKYSWDRMTEVVEELWAR